MLEPSRARCDVLADWFQAEHRSLLRFAFLISGDLATAEDLIQEAFVRIYRAGGRVDREGFPTYARRTVANLGRSAFRRRMRERRITHDPGRLTAEDPAELIRRDDLWKAVTALSPQQRACVALRYYEDMTEQRIAEVLDVSVGTVTKQLTRALAKLRAAVGEEGRS
ncbi:MAG: sigma-70 family RNA polymerase sigma factor [Actinomycetota bacterium]